MTALGDMLEDALKPGEAVPLFKRGYPTSFRAHIPRTRELVPAELRSATHECATGRSPWPLFVHGPVGCGKSRYALCIFDFFVSLFFDFSDLLSEYIDLRRGELRHCDSRLLSWDSESRVREVKWIEALGGRELFILDDIARKQDTEAATARDLMCRFLDKRELLPTILISNLNPAEIAEVYDDRVASRICGGTIYKMERHDMRIEKEQRK